MRDALTGSGAMNSVVATRSFLANRTRPGDRFVQKHRAAWATLQSGGSNGRSCEIFLDEKSVPATQRPSHPCGHYRISQHRNDRDSVIEKASRVTASASSKVAQRLVSPERVLSGNPSSILADAGVEPAPDRNRKRTRAHFLKSHWETLYACDFFSVEVLGVFGTVRTMVFFVMCIKTRAVRIAGVRIAPDGDWMKQIARNLLDPVDGFLRNASHLIHDRDPVFTEAWTALLETGRVTCVPIPARSPNCNPHAERFVKSIRSECLDRFVIFGERHLRHLIREFAAHYHTERYHQGLGSQIIMPTPSPSNDNASLGAIGRRSRLGGLLNFYRREAA